MPRLADVIDKYFIIRSGGDNMPILARQREGGGRLALALLMNDLGFSRGVEIGVNHAKSAEMWCQYIPGLELTAIDPYIVYGHRRSQEKQDAICEEARQKLAAHGAKLLRAKSADVASSFEDESLDFVHIDGNHTFDFAVMDIVQYVPKVRKGGLVIVHDYCNFQWSGVTQAVDGYTHCHDIRPWYVTKGREPTVFWERGAERG